MKSLFHRKELSGHAEQQAIMDLWSRYAGVGLWSAMIHEGDPMHPSSRWQWSQEFRALIGYHQFDYDDFPDIVTSWSDKLHPDDAEPTVKAFMACLNDKTGQTGYDVVYRLQMKTGEYRWFRAIGGVARDPVTKVATKACGALIDVHEQTDRAQTMDLLDTSMGVGFWDAQIHDGDPMHEKSRWQWSQEFRSLLGYAQFDYSSFPDKVQSWSDKLHPDDVEPTFTAFGACLNDRTGRTPYNVEYRLMRKDGQWHWFQAAGGVSRDASGKPVRACGSLIDINARKLSEENQAQMEVEKKQNINHLADILEEQVGQSVERTTCNAQTVASAAAELASSISEISQRVGDAAQASTEASSEGSRTNETVQSLVTAVDQIGAVVNLIEDIAAQTNLLALNATIEAARAGDAGKGFAIVANEVKNLASQTAKATGEISSQVMAVQDEAGNAVRAIKVILDKISSIQSITEAVSVGMGEHDSATRQISERVKSVVTEIQDVASNVVKVTTDLRQS